MTFEPNTEEQLIACALAYPDVILSCSSICLPEHMVAARNRVLWASIVSLATRRLTVDHASVWADVCARGLAAESGGLAHISGLPALAATSAHAETWARQISDAATIRRVKAAAATIAASSDSESAAEYAATAIATIVKAADCGSAPVIRHMMSGASEMMARIESGACAAQPTGIAEIDKLLGGGIHPEMIMIAARSGTGKSTLALNILLSMARMNLPVLYVSLEDSRDVVRQRLLSRETGVFLGKIRGRDLGPTDKRLMYDAIAELNALPLYTWHCPGIQVTDLVAGIRREQASRKYALIVVDYLKRIGDKANKEEFARMQAVCRTIADQAQESAVPIILIHHLRKPPRGDERKPPTLADLLYAGADEARCVILCHWCIENQFVMQLEVAKNNNGPLGACEIQCDLRCMRVGQNGGTDGRNPFVRDDDY